MEALPDDTSRALLTRATNVVGASPRRLISGEDFGPLSSTGGQYDFP